MAESFEFEGNTYEPPVVLVWDRDGGRMPYNPEFKPEDFLADPLSVRLQVPWHHWWCGCGHLTVDHHVDAKSQRPLTMGCWAVGCTCRIGFS